MLQATVSFLEDIIIFVNAEQFTSTVFIIKIVFILLSVLFITIILFLKWKSGVYSDRLTGYSWYYKNLDEIERARAEAKEKEKQMSDEEAEIIKRDSAV